jgi:membrane protease YdiL (CAAX protease family)
MNPFARLRARVLLLGAFVILLLLALALPREGAGTLGIVAGYPLVLLWAVWLAHRAGVDLRRLAGPRVPPDKVVAILALVPALVALDYGVTWVVYTPLSWLSPGYVRDWLNQLERLFPDRPAGLENTAFLFAVIVVAPVVEEVLFRGLLLHRWSYRWGARSGIFLTTIAFAALHASPVSAFLSGLGLAFIYLRTGSLPLTMGAHALNNLIAAVALPWLGGDTAPAGDVLRDFQQGTAQGLFAFITGGIILWLGRRWYVPDLTAALPYDRGSGCRVPRCPGASRPCSAQATRNPERGTRNE